MGYFQRIELFSKITCKDKVIFNRLGYFQSLKITPSLENSPKSQEVAGHCKQKTYCSRHKIFHC
jgi:hypothetical protein